MRLTRGRSAIMVVLLVAFTTAGWAVSTSLPDQRSPVQQAWSVMPAETHTAVLIDWREVSGVVTEVDPADGVAWRRAAAARDLAQRSVLLNHEERIAEVFGWSPRDLAFEGYGQSDEGALLVLGLSGSSADGLTWEKLASRFRTLGYRLDDGIWTLGADEFDAQASGVPQQLRHIAHRPDLGVAIAADREEYVRAGLAVASGEVPGFADRAEIRAALDPLRTSTVASVRRSDVACEALSLDTLTADERGRVRADAPAPLESHEALAFGLRDHGDAQTITSVLVFGDEATAAQQLGVRRALFTGPTLDRTRRFGALVGEPRAAVRGGAATVTFEVADPTSRAFSELTGGVQPAVACELPRGEI